jgi:hypothetical protein
MRGLGVDSKENDWKRVARVTTADGTTAETTADTQLNSAVSV